jgi:transcriptional regulator with GAF, ATPase, and Fis domain
MGKDDVLPSDGGETERLSPENVKLRVPLHRVLLLVYHEHGVETVLLDRGARIVVGRELPSDVVVAEHSLSRQHARFTVIDGRVEVEDLRSTNGTRINGRPMDRCTVKPGDEVMLGAVTVSVHAIAGAWSRPPEVGGREAGGLVMESAAMRDIVEKVASLARAVAPVLLRGETGTGKEEVSRLIHEGGSRRDKPMIPVNCGAIPATLVESFLFGHERGAFTGADQPRPGIFEAANGGTVLLDEIGELPAAAQATLLRTLETRRVVRVGSTKEIEVDVRIVAATHRDLEAMCAAGTFREDLFYRLNVCMLEIPPLRERREDIAPLAERFVRQANEVNDRSVRSIDPDAVALLLQYDWPGNIRELRHCLTGAVVMTKSETIGVRDLPERVRRDAARSPAHVGVVRTPPSREGHAPGVKAQKDRFEAELLVTTLREVGWNQTEAAKQLHMPLRTLQRHLRSLGIKRPV